MTLTSSSLHHTTIQISEKETLRVNEIFLSLQGETSRVGLPTVFIRLTGCPLRCGYCDTEYAFYNGESISISSIMDTVFSYDGIQNVTVTGGEPLAQKKCLLLLGLLCDAGYSVSLETSGAQDISKVDTRVVKVLDVKTPGSGEDQRNNWANLDYLTRQDELKFVLCDEVDYHWSVKKIQNYNLGPKNVRFYFHLYIMNLILHCLPHGYYVIVWLLECRFNYTSYCGVKSQGDENSAIFFI